MADYLERYAMTLDVEAVVEPLAAWVRDAPAAVGVTDGR